MKTMINSVLEKKLEELESLFEAITSNDNDPNLCRKLELGVLFATTLLTAESRSMDVKGEEDVEELRCMAKRLSEMETFISSKKKEMEASITNQLPGHDNGSLIGPEMGSLESNAGIINGETGEVYSLVESCLNESSKAEEEEEEEVEAEQWPLFQDASSEEEREVTFPAVATVKEEVVDREVKEKGRVCLRALVCFGLVGGMISLVGFIGDSMKEDNFFLTPT